MDITVKLDMPDTQIRLAFPKEQQRGEKMVNEEYQEYNKDYRTLGTLSKASIIQCYILPKKLILLIPSLCRVLRRGDNFLG